MSKILVGVRRPFKPVLLLSFISLCCIFSGCITFGVEQPSHRQIADELTKEEQYELAIEAYQAHIQARLQVEGRPEWENPYIYLLDIGDIYLAQSKVTKALETYEEARAKKVKAGYVNDRFRHVAAWYEKQGRYDEALKILERYRDRDPMLFDLMMDRIAKTVVADEESKLDLELEEPLITVSPTPAAP